MASLEGVRLLQDQHDPIGSLLRERLHAPDRQINSTVNHASGDEGRYDDDDGFMTTMMNWLRVYDDVLRRLWKQVSELAEREESWQEYK